MKEFITILQELNLVEMEYLKKIYMHLNMMIKRQITIDQNYYVQVELLDLIYGIRL